MRTLFRVLSIILIFCVLGSFIGLIVTLIKGLFNLVFIVGGFLVGFLAMSWVLNRFSNSYEETHPDE